MSFIEDIKGCFSPDEMPTSPTFRAVLFGDNAAYFENVKTIISYQRNEILLALTRGRLKVKGENLYVKKYCAGDVAVCGKICAIERV
jgi:sporulation protein YqfC